MIKNLTLRICVLGSKMAPITITFELFNHGSSYILYMQMMYTTHHDDVQLYNVNMCYLRLKCTCMTNFKYLAYNKPVKL